MTAIRDLETHDGQYVTVGELAAYWRVTDRAIHYWVAKGSLPAVRTGRLIRIRTEDARRFGRPKEIVTGPLGSV